MKQTQRKQAIFILIACCFMILTILSCFGNEVLASSDEEVKYLSDLDYITTNNWSYVSWGSIKKDAPPEGSKITLKENGKNKIFFKGLGIHAKAQITYDISELSGEYTRFITKAGVDASRGNNSNGVWFRVLVSNDGNKWTNLIAKSSVVTGVSDALNIDVNIEGYKYLRIYVDPNGSNAADHAVLGGAKLVKSDYVDKEETYDKIHKLEYYDEILGSHDADYNYNNNYRLILEREFVRKFDYNTIVSYANYDNKARETFDWLFSKDDTLEQVVEVGELNTVRFIEVLSNLYCTYKEDLKTENGYVYQKMIISLAASYSTDALIGPLNFGEQTATYDYIERFEILKYLFDNNKFRRVNNTGMTGTMVHNDWVKDYHVALMRLLMKEPVRNDEFVWLNEYCNTPIAKPNGQGNQTGYNFYWYAYVSPVYNRPEYRDEANREKYVKKYMLEDEVLGEKYKVPYGDGAVRFWMTLENGGICWNASRAGQSMNRVNGLPAVGAYQVGHELYITYYQTNDGKGFWSTRYGNWSGAGTTWGGGQRVRLLFNWGNKYFADQKISGNKIASSTGYLYLGQDNLNNLEAYRKSLYYDLVANSYTDNNQKIETYFKSLEINDLNLDTYDYMISLYKNMSVKNQGGTITSNDWATLARKIITAYEHHPVALFDLIKVIRPYLEGADRIEIDGLEREVLTRACSYTSNDEADHAEPTRVHAIQLLNQAQDPPMAFSFDGENAGKLVRNSNYENAYKYSLDNGETWVADFKTEPTTTLTAEEIASITPEKDILIKFMGLESIIYTIDITKGTLPNNLYNNDLENRIICANETLEWRLNDTDAWTSYKTAEPDLTGDKTVEIRKIATGTAISSDSRRYTFTADNQPDTRKYIPLSRIKLHTFSSEATGGGQNGHIANALDGNINTRWHSNYSGGDSERFISIELDKTTFISAVEYVPAGSGNGCVSAGKVFISLDGTNWTEVETFSGWGNNANIKTVNFSKSKEAKYVKFQATSNYGDGRTFIAAKMFNFYEDITKVCVADFRLDGEEAGKIKIRDQYKNLNWQYSIDGGVNWKNGTLEVHQLNNEELKVLTAENDIKIRFAEDTTEYLIDLDKKAYNETPYVNDLENRLIGLKDATKLEWKFNDGSWKAYAEEEPNLTEDSEGTLYVRTKAEGEYVASDIAEYQFTVDNQPDNRKYIPISHLSVHEYSSQSIDSTRPYYAQNAIDGNINTLWHTDFRYSIEGKRATYTIKLDTSKYISALEYKQKKYRSEDPCIIKNAYVYVSENGQDWIEAGRIENAIQDENLKNITFNESIVGQYVKIEMEGYGIFASLAMVNLYEDITVKKVASFSFDGEEANKIILTDEFKGSNWEYSLNSGTTWKHGIADTHTLTLEEVETVNGDDKIKIRINNKEYTIGIQKSLTPVISAYLNDLENRLIGMEGTDVLEWKIERNESRARSINGWTDYSTEEPIVEGDAKLLIRKKARGIFVPSDVVEFNFTADNQEDTRKYIPVSKLEVAGVSAEDKAQNGAAANAIDGNYNTRWLNSAAGTDTEKYIIVKFDSAVYLSAMDYVPHTENGKILGGTIQGSMDGENFTDIATITGWANDQNTKTIDFDEPIKVRYVKITGTNTSYTSAKRHVGARMFNFYEDITKKDVVIPTAEVKYSNKELTNQDVVVTLINPSTEITVLNNNGSTEYTFTENGSFTFQFEDSEGNKGSTTATVDWICKTLPEAIFEYDIPTPTNKDVTVTVKFKVNGEPSDKVTILNNEGNNKHTFTENGNFTFEFRGPYGNEGTATANVDWICKTLPEAIFEYSTEEITNQPVTVTVKFKVKGEFNENVTILNNDGSNKYTFNENGEFKFKFRGPYGNEGEATAKVTWIDNTIPTATVKYDITDKTNKNVVATLDKKDKNLTITNNDGKDTYTFTENGSFTFEFTNELGNKGTATATVNWIDKKVPTGNISYNIMQATNQPVIATIKFDKQNVRIKNNDGKDTYTFTENKEFTFEFVDEYGNEGTAKAEVNWIDKTLPVAKITYNTTEMTNKDVVATISFTKNGEELEGVTVEGGNTHTFTENGEYEFQFIGPAGNKGVAKAVVNWIDKDVPVPTLFGDTVTPTNKDVTVLVLFEEEEGEVTITNNDGKNSYTFTENGNFTFEFRDRAGNKGSVDAVVNCIDKVAPTAKVIYDVTKATNGNVVATLVEESEEITINSEGGNTHTFTENGEFTFEFVDRVGNKGVAKAAVNWIDKLLPIAEVTYNTTKLTNQDVIATINFTKNGVKLDNVTVAGGNTHTFTENGEYIFEYVDEAGNTGMKSVSVNWIDKTVPTATVTYDVTTETEGNVVATLGNASEEITITSEGGNKHTFAANGSFTFEFVDKAGNKGTAKAEVTWIKTAEEKYQEIKAQAIKTITDYQAKVTEEELSNKKVNVEEKKAVIEAYNKLREEDKAPYVEFINKVKAGGKPVITNIAKTLKYKEGDDLDLYSLITIKDNEDGNIIPNKDTVKITTNLDTEKAGTYDVSYEVTDADGNKEILKIQIVIEENTAPRFKAVLSTPKEKLNPGDNFEVIVSICNIKNIEKGLIAIAGRIEYNKDVLELIDIVGENKWNFDENSFNEDNLKFITENGQYVLSDGVAFRINMKVKETLKPENIIETNFRIRNLEGSNGEIDIVANDVALKLQIAKKEEPIEPFKISSEKYEISDNIIKYVLPNTTVANFNKNITVNRTTKVVDKENNEQTAEAILKTGMKLKVEKENKEYTIVVLGDIKEDGRMDIIDLAKIKLHLIDKEILTGINLIAADVNKDGEVNINDLAIMKLVIIGLKEIN